jgi:hypothetical protein
MQKRAGHLRWLAPDSYTSDPNSYEDFSAFVEELLFWTAVLHR